MKTVTLQIIIVIHLSLLLACFANDIHLIVTENTPENYEITDLKSRLNFRKSQKFKLRLHSPNKYRSYFRLINTKLYIRKSLDREELCRNRRNYDPNENCIIKIMILLTEKLGKPPKFINIMLTINDINDNEPEFPESTVEHTVLENASPNLSDLYLYQANDPDRLKNGTVSYKLIDSNTQRSSNTFRLQEYGKDVPKLVQLRKLDYEKMREYKLTLIASDHGTPPKSGSLLITVKVKDENDNIPKFTETKYEKTIKEDIMISANVLEIIATDEDNGLNGQVNYKMGTLANDEQRLANQYFDVRNHNDKGVIYVKNSIDVDEIDSDDRDNNGKFEFSVIACDQGQPRHCSRTPVTIRVLDVNDFRPKIIVNYLNNDVNSGMSFGDESSSYRKSSATIKENTIHNYIAMVTVVDKDSGPGGQVECSLKNPSFELISSDSSMGSSRSFSSITAGSRSKYYYIKNLKKFDREVDETIRFKIACKDNPNYQTTPYESIQLTSEQEIVVRVSDVNDNPPRFLQSNMKLEVDENRPRFNEDKVRLGKINVADADLNSEFNFSLIRNPRNAFSIDKYGVVFINQAFDREDMPKNPLRLEVNVTDGKFNSNLLVSVFIKDQNDLKPEFKELDYRFSVTENAYSAFVGKVEAQDQDSQQFGPLEYRILGHRTKFSIHPRLGVIRSTSNLDREKRDSYTLTVLVIDNVHKRSRIRNTNSVSVTIDILDLNDNYPVIDYPKQHNAVVIDPSWPVGHKVLRVKAHDPDFKQNGTITYRLPKDSLGIFKIDSLCGDLFLSKRLPMDLASNYRGMVNSHLMIVASDQGIPTPKSTAVSVTVRITNGADDSGNNYFGDSGANRGSNKDGNGSGNPGDNAGRNQGDHATQPHTSRTSRRTLIIIIIIALALVVTVIMTVIIVIYQIRLPMANQQSMGNGSNSVVSSHYLHQPPNQMGGNGAGNGTTLASLSSMSMGTPLFNTTSKGYQGEQNTLLNKGDRFYTTMNLSGVEDNFSNSSKRFQNPNTSTLSRRDQFDKSIPNVTLDEYQRLMTTSPHQHHPLQVWHNNLSNPPLDSSNKQLHNITFLPVSHGDNNSPYNELMTNITPTNQQINPQDEHYKSLTTNTTTTNTSATTPPLTTTNDEISQQNTITNSTTGFIKNSNLKLNMSKIDNKNSPTKTENNNNNNYLQSSFV